MPVWGEGFSFRTRALALDMRANRQLYATMLTSSDLTTWAHQHISAIYEANSDHDLHKAFENTFSPSLEFFVNHQQLSRELMKEDMTKRRAACVSASVKRENSMDFVARLGSWQAS